MDIIWIHGFGESSIVWNDFVPKIDASFHHHLFDFSKEKDHKTISDYAKVLKDFTKDKKIENPVIIGHSMGGYIAIEYAAQNRDDISGLGLFHSSAKDDSEQKKKERLKTIDFIANYGAEVFVRNYYKNLFSVENQEKYKQIINENTQQLLIVLETEALISATRSMMNRNNNYQTLQDLEVPVFQILGKLDPFILLEDGLEQTLLLKRPYTLVLDEVSHAGMYEAENACIGFINNYLKKIS